MPGPVRAQRTLRVPREEVFAAWTDPERLRQWWGPPGFSVDRIDADLRVGGAYRIVMRPSDGNVRELLWLWEEISPPERLVYRWRWVLDGVEQPETHVTVDFRDAPEGTRVELVHHGFPDRAEWRHHDDGWRGCLERLEAKLNQVV
jgi:uncharacterized protein YndB with AHSA1/START domain